MRAIEEIFGLNGKGVLSLVGGGGKTSLMFHLARRLARSGRRVLTTTTTKIFIPTTKESPVVIVNPDPKAVLKEAYSCGGATLHLTAAARRLDDSGKLAGFPPETVCRLWESEAFDWILVEADGAARRPLKAPAPHEPVIPACTTVLVAVVGLEVLGAPFSEDLVFRSDLAAPLMSLSRGETITPEALARLLVHPSGLFRGAPKKARRFIFLNKADTPALRAAGSAVADRLKMEPGPVAEAVLVGQTLSTIRIHREHRLGDS